MTTSETAYEKLKKGIGMNSTGDNLIFSKAYDAQVSVPMQLNIYDFVDNFFLKKRCISEFLTNFGTTELKKTDMVGWG